MRQGNNNKQRSRGRSGRRPQGGNNANRVYDSNGPSGKLRGSAAQLVDKYLALANDARSNRDRVIVEGLLQHAEHYQRILNENNAAKAQEQAKRQAQNQAQNQGQNQSPDQANGEQQGNGAANDQANGATPVAADVAGSDQPQIDVDAAAGDQPAVDLPVEEKAAPVRRQRRTPTRRRTTKAKDASGDEAKAAPAVEEAPVAAADGAE